jgi:ATP-dependent Clp protease adaptor protein ClpS
MSQTIELPITAGPDGALGGAWRVIVCNDDHNTFDHVAGTLAKLIPGIDANRGYAIADRIHAAGLAIVWTGHKELAEHYWDQLRDAGLTMAPLEQA